MNRRLRKVAWAVCILWLGACQTQTSDWTLGVPDAPDLPQGYELRLEVTLNPRVEVGQTIELDVAPSQAGITAALSKRSLTASSPVTVTISSRGDLPPGPYSVAVTGQDSQGQRSSAIVPLRVVRRIACPPNGYACEDGMFLDVPASPVAIRRGQSVTVTGQLKRRAANPSLPAGALNSSATLTVDDLPDGVTAQFTPALLTLEQSAELKLTAGADAPLGVGAIRVRVTGNLETFVLATVNVNVQP